MTSAPHQSVTQPLSQPAGHLLAAPEHVLAASRPRPRVPVYHVAVIAFVATLAGMFFGDGITDGASLVRKIVPLIVPLGVLAFALCWGAHLAAEMRAEDRAVGNAEDALHAERLELAAHIIANLTASAMYSNANRFRALWVYIGALLDLRRFDDVVSASGQMLAEGVPSDMAGPLWAAMAYSLLREDRLVDATGALHELRKLSRSDSAGPAPAMLALVEMYRDVTSGHPDEVLESHAKHRDAIAAALGYRVSDADALAALAAHLRQRHDFAATLWQRATLLQPAAELLTRYPELQPLITYPASPPLAQVIGRPA